ncbi:MAG TPA: hypothetical protein VMX16_09465 [Terriglobia bacterium]|nr:hypothetical protein [Terriglobia bacterium]
MYSPGASPHGVLPIAAGGATRLVNQKAWAIVGSPQPLRPLEIGKDKPPKHKKHAGPADLED